MPNGCTGASPESGKATTGDKDAVATVALADLAGNLRRQKRLDETEATYASTAVVRPLPVIAAERAAPVPAPAFVSCNGSSSASLRRLPASL